MKASELFMGLLVAGVLFTLIVLRCYILPSVVVNEKRGTENERRIERLEEKARE